MPIPIADFRLDLFDPTLFSSTTFRGWKPPLGEFIQNKHTLFFSFLTEEIGQKVIPGKWVVQRLSTNNLLVTDNLNQCWKDWVLKLRQQECVCVYTYTYVEIHTLKLYQKKLREIGLFAWRYEVRFPGIWLDGYSSTSPLPKAGADFLLLIHVLSAGL